MKKGSYGSGVLETSSEDMTSYASPESTHEGEPFVSKAFRAECAVNRDHTGNRAM